MKKWLKKQIPEEIKFYFSNYLKHQLFTVFFAYAEEIGIRGKCDLHNRIHNVTINITPSDDVTL